MKRGTAIGACVLAAAVGLLAHHLSSAYRRAAPQARRVASPPKPGVERPMRGLSDEEARQVVARIDGREITVLDVADELHRLRGDARASAVLPANRAALLDGLLRDELLADEARRRGYEDAPAVVAARREALARQLAGLVRDETTLPEPSLEALRAHYGAHREQWDVPERVTLRYLALPTRPAAEEALAEIESASRPDHAFRRLADAHAWGAPGLGSHFGELGPFARPELARPEDARIPRGVARAGFATEAGQIHPSVIEDGGLFFVVRVLSRDPATHVQFDEARPQLRAQLRAEAIAERLDELAFAGRTIRVGERALVTVRDPYDPTLPP